MKIRVAFFPKIAALMMTLSAMVIIAVSVVAIHINREALNLLVKKFFISITDDISNVIRNQYNSVIAELSEYTEILSNSTLDIGLRINLISLKISNAKFTDFAIVYNGKGELLDVFKPRGFSLPCAVPKHLTPAVIDSLRHRRYYISPPFHADSGNAFLAQVIVPWHQQDSVLAGFVCTFFDLKSLHETILSTSIKRFGNDESIFAVNPEGRVIAGRVAFSGSIAGTDMFKNAGTAEQFKSLFNQSLGFTTEYRDAKNRPMVGSYVTLPEYGMAIAVCQPYQKAFYSLYRMRNMIWLIALVSFVVTAFASLIFSGMVTAPLRNLTKTIRLMAKDRVPGRTVAVSTTDETGDLAASFNEMSCEMAKYHGEIVEARNNAEKQLELFLLTLASAIESKDRYTGGHVERVANYSRDLAVAMGLATDHVKNIYLAAIVHDVGKIGVADAVLNKEGKLDPNELLLMKKHTLEGNRILGKIGELKIAAIIALNHQEHWDGSGYPNGLVGKNIPLEARIVCVADYWDAIVTDRPYRKAMPLSKALAIMQEERGKAFDPELLDIFLKNQIFLRYIMDEKKRELQS